MCSNLEDDNYIDLNGAGSPNKVDKKLLKSLKICRKCDNESFVLLQKKDALCRTCFDEYCFHKFRSTVGKSKLVKNGMRVLIAYSGGASSAALLKFVTEGLGHPEEHRRYLYIPHIVHIDESAITPADKNENCFHQERAIISKMLKSGWKCYLSSIEKAFCGCDETFYEELSSTDTTNNRLVSGPKKLDALKKALSNLKTLTSKEELIRRLRTQLLVDIAQKEKLDVIFLGTNGSRLAIQLITDVAQGKGNQIHLETGFCDDRFQGIPILKPLREFVSKEITFYNKLKQIDFEEKLDLLTKKPNKASIGKLTESFINDLQVNFPATVYTLYKISAKVKPYHSTTKKCILCGANNDQLEGRKCSAQTALALSQQLSRNEDQLASDGQDAETTLPGVELGNKKRLLDNLCYGCVLIANEMSSYKEIPEKIIRKAVTKDQLAEFLIGD